MTLETHPQVLSTEAGPVNIQSIQSEIRPYIPVEAKFIEESFKGLDEELTTNIKEGYGYGPSTAFSAGLDLRYVGKESLLIRPGQCVKIHTGLAIHLNNPSLVGIITPRSGLGSQGIVLGNLIGIIDADYTGELILTLWNRNDLNSYRSIPIEPGERVAQYLVLNRHELGMSFVDEFSKNTERNAGGFGSTGRF